MSVTFSGAFTFSGGGFTATLAPPPSEATAGWFIGGFSGTRKSTIDRITFATDTATASVRGPLNLGINGSAGAGNTTDGWSGGGQTSPSSISTVNRIIYATDTAIASVRGPLSSAKTYLAATGNTTDGWFAGGVIGNGFFPCVSIVDRVTYATDTTTASVRGPISSENNRIAAAGTNTDGWIAGQVTPGPGSGTIVNRITYATDTATASIRGPLAVGTNAQAASSDNTTYGWWSGGAIPSALGITTIQRITFATDTATASIRGPLSVARGYMAATGDTTYGWVGGGYPTRSTVDRITYATDTATSSVRGPLSSARYGLAGTSGIQ